MVTYVDNGRQRYLVCKIMRYATHIVCRNLYCVLNATLCYAYNEIIISVMRD